MHAQENRYFKKTLQSCDFRKEIQQPEDKMYINLIPLKLTFSSRSIHNIVVCALILFYFSTQVFVRDLNQLSTTASFTLV